MANEYYGKQILGELSDNQTLPNAGTVDSTNMVNIAGQTNGKLWIDVYAGTDISIADDKKFYIELEGYSSDDNDSATPPFSTANSGGMQGASGVLESDAHYYLLHKTADDGALAFSKGSLITQCAIPEDLFRLLKYDFVQLKYTTDADESSETVTAFVYSKM